MLCGICERAISSIRKRKPGSYDGPEPERFQFAERTDTWRGAHHIDDDSFLSAVKRRCYICYTLDEACPKEARKHSEFFRTFYEIQPDGSDRYSLQFAIELRQRSPSMEAAAQVIEPHGTFRILPRIDVPNAGVRLSLTKNTLSGECETQVRSWLEECTAKHRECNEDWRTTYDYPVRLLNVSPELGQRVRLDTFDKAADLAPYVTMSHCWNHDREVHLMKLTNGNYDELSKGFEISALPKKFRDAIEIARWMNVNFLWIDALCIIQDSREDWQFQSSVMGDIYAGSYCNIAATNAGENMGCFRERPVEIVEPYFIRDPKLPPDMEETHVIGYDDFWCNSLLHTDLHARAWVLQERLLSPRTIHFGKEQMFWECRIHKACEAYPTGIPAKFSNRRTDAWRQGEETFKPKSKTKSVQHGAVWKFILGNLPDLSWLTNPPQAVRFEHAYIFWSRTVERYMQCNLSFSSDKLVAIAGIANKVKETTGERYLAGLWDNSYLPQSLLWYVPVREQADGRRSVRSSALGDGEYRAPSWSWASVDAKIVWNWPVQCDQILFHVECTDVQVPGDGVGAVTSAEMRGRGRLVAVQLQIMHRNEDGSPAEDGSYALTPKQTYVATTASGRMTVPLSYVEPLVYLDTALAPTFAIEAYLLPLCTQWRDRNRNVRAAIAGLILRKSELANRTVYERIGVFGLDERQVHVLGNPWGCKYDTTAHSASMETMILV